MPSREARTWRDLIDLSWRESLKRADTDGYVVLNPASFAGYVLERSGGDVPRARGLIPGERVGFWSDVHDRLDAVATEDMVTDAKVGT